jgi:hypothetical protein
MVFLVSMIQFQVITASAITENEEAAAALATAEKAVALAYNSSVRAEQAGANISGLFVMLKDAGDELSKAEIAYMQGDFNLTLSSATICSQIAQRVNTGADQLRLEAFGPRYIDIWLKMTVSIFAVVGVGIVGLWAWRVFKRRYYQRVLMMKPENVSHES